MYKCKSTFVAKNNKQYSYGDKINASEYNSLEYYDKRNFEEEEEESSSSYDYGSDNSSSSGFDFGGGESGGAGSGGDW